MYEGHYGKEEEEKEGGQPSAEDRTEEILSIYERVS